MESPKPQISGTSHFSNSVISEPPDIKQWFSSYTYQSPELDTNEKDLCFSHGVDDEETGLYVEDSETEDENGEDLSKWDGFMNCNSIEEAREYEVPSLPGVEVPACPDSLSMPSEPPDITNWFSSYVYESPELDSADFDVSLLSDYNFGKKKEVDKEREDHSKGLPVIEIGDEILSCTETIPRFNRVNNSKIPFTLKESDSESTLYPENGLCSARTYDESNYEVELNNRNKIQNKYFDSPRIKSEDIIPSVKIEKHISYKEHIRSPPKTPFSTYASDEKKTEKKLVPDKSDSGWISLNRNKPSEENQITSMKSRVRPISNKENSHMKSVYSSDRPKEKSLKRGILKETTNFNVSCSSEVSGKWRCPQKYKPDTGPPLKQLRLEKWFHR